MKSLNVAPFEWRWATGAAVIMMLIILCPTLYGFALSTPDHWFGGFVIGLEDGNSYLAKMQEGRAGHWLFYLAYTPEPHQGAPFFLYYILLGKLSALLNVSPLVTLHLSRLVTIPFGLLSFYAFAAYFSPNIAIRRLALLLFGASAGLGWLWLLLGYPAELGAMPVDLWVPDASFFLAALTFPHLPLSQGLLLWVVLGTLIFLERGDFRSWLVGAGAGLLVSLIHPYKLAVLTPIFLTYLAWESYRRQRLVWRSLWRLGLIILPAAPYLLYVLYVFETNFAFRAWREQSLTWSPQPIHYLLGFGLLLPLAGLGVAKVGQMQIRPVSFLITWLLVTPLLLYLPLPLQRRFVDGYQAVIVLLAAVGLVWLLDQVRPRRWPSLVLIALYLPLTLTNLLLLGGALLTIHGRQPPVFYPGARQEALHWLAANAPGQIVLSTVENGNAIPAYGPARVFVGHGPETIRSEEKIALVAQFFSGSTTDAWRRQLLKAYGVDYIYYGPQERAAGGFRPEASDFLEAVYDNELVEIYQVIELE